MPLGCIYMYSPHCVKAIGVFLRQWQLWTQLGCWYIHIAWGFLSLLVPTNRAIPTSLKEWSERQCRASRFLFVFIVLIYITLGCRSPRPEKEKSSLGIGNDATRSECEAN